MREHRKLRFNPVAFLLEIAFQDGAFRDVDFMETFKRWDPDHNDPVPLVWKPSMAREPVLRTATRAGGISKRPWTRESFCKLFRAVVTNAGYPEIITIHTLRRGLANMLDSKFKSAPRLDIPSLTFDTRSGNRGRKEPGPYPEGSEYLRKKLHRQYLGTKHYGRVPRREDAP